MPDTAIFLHFRQIFLATESRISHTAARDLHIKLFYAADLGIISVIFYLGIF